MELLLVFLTPMHFFFMVRETTSVDMTSRVSKIVDVCSDVLVNFLVVLARVVDAVAPSSPLERLSIVAVLVGETTSVGAAIRSWRDGSTNQARRAGRSLILADLVDLAVRRFKYGGDLGDLWCLREPSELVGWRLGSCRRRVRQHGQIHRQGCGGVGVAFLVSQAAARPSQG